MPTRSKSTPTNKANPIVRQARRGGVASTPPSLHGSLVYFLHLPRQTQPAAPVPRVQLHARAVQPPGLSVVSLSCFCGVSYRVVSRHVVLCHRSSCHNMLCHAMPCHVVVEHIWPGRCWHWSMFFACLLSHTSSTPPTPCSRGHHHRSGSCTYVSRLHTHIRYVLVVQYHYIAIYNHTLGHGIMASHDTSPTRHDTYKS